MELGHSVEVYFDLLLDMVMIDNFCQQHGQCKYNLFYKGRSLTKAVVNECKVTIMKGRR